MQRFFAAVLLVALAACSSSGGPKPAPLPELQDAKQARVLWSAQVGSAERFTFSPAVVGDAVFAAGRDGSVARFDATSGEQRWRASLDTKLSAGVGAGERTVVVATEEGEVIALEALGGKELWRARVSSEVLAAPAVGAGLVLVRSVDNRVFAFGEADGKRRWVYQRTPASLVVRAPAGLTLADGLAFAGFSGGRLVAIALENGVARWEASVAAPKGATELERVTDVIGRPPVQGREVCAAAYQGRVACYDMATARPLWGRDISSLSGVSLDARYAMLSDERGVVHVLDRTNGQSLWRQERLANRQLSLPASAGGFVAVGDFEGYVHFLARDTGAFLTRYATGGGAVRAAPVPLGAGVLVQTRDGGLYALGL